MAGALGLAVFQRVVEIVKHHGVQLHNTEWRLEQLAAHFGCTDHGDVFVLGNGLDLIIVEVAEVQAIFETKHGSLQS
jgi:hypothetical protein